MESCPICDSITFSSSTECSCGFDIKANEITSRRKIFEYYNKIKHTDWKIRVNLTRKIHEIQQNKHGYTRIGARGVWKMEQTGKLLSEQKSSISTFIKLAYGLEYVPSLEKCKNIKQAEKHFKEYDTINKFLEKIEPERKFKKYLVKNWEKSPFSDNWSFFDNEFNTDVGNIDIIAKHRTEDKWLVIELKSNAARLSAISQILKYMGWVD